MQIKEMSIAEEEQLSPGRRAFLRGTGTLGTAALFGSLSTGFVGAHPIETDHESPELKPFVDGLTRPPVLEGDQRRGVTHYDVPMVETTQQLHSDLDETTLWTYGGHYPGPTIVVDYDEEIHVVWRNELPDQHLLPVDTTVHGAGHEHPKVRTVVHLHGGNTREEYDGYPEAWFTSGFEETGPFFEEEVYEYANEQPPATLWYHDHALGITRLNVYAGLAGAYIIRGRDERRYRLPRGEYELPLIIQDRTFYEDGSLFYPFESETEDGERIGTEDDPSIVPEFFGDTAVVNGTVWPRFEVEPRKYRFRTVNGSNSRFYNLELIGYDDYDSNDDAVGTAGPRFHQIGTDGGFLPRPIEIDDRLLLGPAERADLIVDFSGCEGQSFLLHNDAGTPFTGFDQEENEVPLPQIMRFDVQDTSVRDQSRIPACFFGETSGQRTPVPEIPSEDAVRTRTLTLEEETDEHGRLLLLLDGLEWDDEITEDPELGTTEIWELVNLTEDAHPIHLHLVQFQILERAPFDVDVFVDEGELVEDEASDPLPNERGWKDTVTAFPEEVTRIIAHFGEYEGQFRDIPGQFVWHCHILEHEDHEMMRPYTVVDE